MPALVLLPFLLLAALMVIFLPKRLMTLQEQQRKADEKRSDARLQAILARELELMKRQQKS